MQQMAEKEIEMKRQYIDELRQKLEYAQQEYQFLQ